MKKLILGANGPIGTQLCNVLKDNNHEIVRFGRTEINASDYVVGDALVKDDLLRASEGCDIVYVAIGLKYDHEVWKRDWPIIIRNVIDVAKEKDLKVVFFDNIYLYGPELAVPITEEHRISPISEKGEAREVIHNLLTAAMGDVDILIARASDFFGPMANFSMIHSSFLENMLEGKSPNFLGSANKKHSYSYNVDLARAMALLGDDQTAYNQVWHLPSYQTNSIHEMVDAYNRELNTDIKLKTTGRTMHRILGMFIPFLKELYEMRYQFDNDYVLSFDKFSRKYPEFEQTKFEDAIATTVDYFK